MVCFVRRQLSVIICVLLCKIVYICMYNAHKIHEFWCIWTGMEYGRVSKHKIFYILYMQRTIWNMYIFVSEFYSSVYMTNGRNYKHTQIIVDFIEMWMDGNERKSIFWIFPHGFWIWCAVASNGIGSDYEFSKRTQQQQTKSLLLLLVRFFFW